MYCQIFKEPKQVNKSHTQYSLLDTLRLSTADVDSWNRGIECNTDNLLTYYTNMALWDGIDLYLMKKCYIE